MSKVSAQDMNRFFRDNFTGNPDALPDITLAEPDHVIMRASMGEQNIRPGGFVSGPTQMQLADHIAYAVIFTRLGICLLYTSPSPRDRQKSRMPSSA